MNVVHRPFLFMAMVLMQEGVGRERHGFPIKRFRLEEVDEWKSKYFRQQTLLQLQRLR
jgi:hypothetical protein